jgi:hypothetical protein
MAWSNQRRSGIPGGGYHLGIERAPCHDSQDHRHAGKRPHHGARLLQIAELIHRPTSTRPRREESFHPQRHGLAELSRRALTYCQTALFPTNDKRRGIFCIKISDNRDRNLQVQFIPTSTELVWQPPRSLGRAGSSPPLWRPPNGRFFLPVVRAKKSPHFAGGFSCCS